MPPEARPPWWPNDLPFPPPEQEWRRRRAGMARRMATFVLFLVLLVCVAGWIVGGLLYGDHRDGGPPGPPLFILGVLAVIAGIILFKTRRYRGSFGSAVELMAGVDRVARGDYRVRVSPRGAPDLQQLTHSFNTMVERLALNQEQRQRLLADIAHELRTPLAVIQGTIEGIIDGVYPGDSAHLTPLLAEVAVITRLLDDLQLLAHAEAGELRLYREPVDLAALVSELIAAFAPQARPRGVELISAVDAGLDIELDPIRIRQVLENLLSNALRYTPDGGSVTISAARSTDQVVIEVRDTGQGITDEERARMFERFVKSADSGGSGLGLAIARSLVEAHSGRISAAAAPGGGTIVSFTLPPAITPE